MKQQCASCQKPFQVTSRDLEFYEQVSPVIAGKTYNIPAPRHCPACREQKQMAWCNEQYLYHNTCAKTGKPLISSLHASNPRPVWNITDWWSDAFKPLEYGQEIDWNRSVLEQIHELELKVPHACVNTDLDNENSEYTHYAGHEKNCYLLFHASFAEDCMYGYGIKKSKSCTDNYYCHESELCYECIDVKNCYSLAWSQDCQNCSACRFIRDCIGCQECVLCVGLRNKKFCIFNQQFTEQEYKKRIAEISFGSYATVQSLQKKFEELQLKHTWKCCKNEMVENCLGDHLTKAKDSEYCYDSSDVEGCKYCSQLQLGAKFCYDIYQFGIGIEFCYDSSQIGYSIYNCHFCFELLEGCNELLYCISCFASKNCFGCFGLRHNQYCIFNTQYSKEEYEALVPKLIAKMEQDGEWGEFFPMKYSQSAYNETMAQLWYPLTKDQIKTKGLAWLEQEEEQQYMGPKIDLPDNIANATEEICSKILTCSVTGKPYKIIPQELKFYQQIGVPLPRTTYKHRHMERFKKRNPRTLFQRTCDKCSKEIQTTYAPDRPETVYCESCYLTEIC